MNPERYRLALVREPAVAPIGDQIRTPADLASIAKQLLGAEPQELIVSIHLDRKHRVRGYQEVSRGGLDSAPCDFRGDPAPSADDVALTRRVSRSAELLGIEFLDHLVVTSDGWTSLHEAGAL